MKNVISRVNRRRDTKSAMKVSCQNKTKHAARKAAKTIVHSLKEN
jgi:hypothetical protein